MSFSEQQQQLSGSVKTPVRWLIQRVPLAAATVAAAEAAAAQATAADVSSQRELYSGLYNGNSTDAKFCRRG